MKVPRYSKTSWQTTTTTKTTNTTRIKNNLENNTAQQETNCKSGMSDVRNERITERYSKTLQKYLGGYESTKGKSDLEQVTRIPNLQSGNPSQNLLKTPSSSDPWFHLDEATPSASVGCRVPQLVNWVTSLFASEHHFGLGTRPTLMRNGAKDEESHNGQTMDQFKVVKIDLCFRSKRCFFFKNAREISGNPNNIEATVVQILYPQKRSLLHIYVTSKILQFSTCVCCIKISLQFTQDVLHIWQVCSFWSMPP